MPFSYTNAAGEVQLNGGTLALTGGTSGMTGGILDGTGAGGTMAVYDGGTDSPGPGAGLIRFFSGLTLGTNAILSIDGTGTVPGVTYDQLSVTGAVAISNCTLQVASLPTVPAGTIFVIITNTTAKSDGRLNFNGLPENSPLTISGQPISIFITRAEAEMTWCWCAIWPPANARHSQITVTQIKRTPARVRKRLCDLYDSSIHQPRAMDQRGPGHGRCHRQFQLHGHERREFPVSLLSHDELKPLGVPPASRRLWARYVGGALELKTHSPWRFQFAAVVCDARFQPIT